MAKKHTEAAKNYRCQGAAERRSVASLDSEASNYYRENWPGTAGGRHDNKYSGLGTVVSLEILYAG